jgi:hypothetical protein
MRLTARSHEEASSYFEKCRDVLVNELQTNSIVLKNLETESLATISADMVRKLFLGVSFNINSSC